MFSKLKFIKLNEIDSTNDYAKYLLRLKKESLPFLVQTLFQTKGRGQLGKYWYSDKNKNLLCSLAFQVQNIRIEEQFIISQVIAVSLYNILQQYQVDAFIKWPNDIYVKNKKIAGILIENSLTASRIDSTIIGLGFNINQTVFPDDLRNRAISLKTIKSENIDIDMFRIKWLKSVLWAFSEDREKIKEIYHQVLYQRDETHKYKDAKEEFNATILGVDAFGKLILQTNNGTIKYYMNNELQYL